MKPLASGSRCQMNVNSDSQTFFRIDFGPTQERNFRVLCREEYSLQWWCWQVFPELWGPCVLLLLDIICELMSSPLSADPAAELLPLMEQGVRSRGRSSLGFTSKTTFVDQSAWRTRTAETITKQSINYEI